MSDDILKQLRRTNGYDILREEPIYVNPDGPKAADEIERLRAELAVERENNKSFNKHLTRARGNTQTMKAERDELRAALQYARNLIGPDEIIDAALNNGGGDE